jgi:hypothetical protein
LRVDEAARRCGLRPWIAQARYERSWSSVSMICQESWQRAGTRCRSGKSDYATDESFWRWI